MQGKWTYNDWILFSLMSILIAIFSCSLIDDRLIEIHYHNIGIRFQVQLICFLNKYCLNIILANRNTIRFLKSQCVSVIRIRNWNSLPQHFLTLQGRYHCYKHTTIIAKQAVDPNTQLDYGLSIFYICEEWRSIWEYICHNSIYLFGYCFQCEFGVQDYFLTSVNGSKSECCSSQFRKTRVLRETLIEQIVSFRMCVPLISGYLVCVANPERVNIKDAKNLQRSKHSITPGILCQSLFWFKFEGVRNPHRSYRGKT